MAAFEIAHIAGEQPEVVTGALLSMPLLPSERDALLREILYLLHTGILPEKELDKLKGLPLQQVIFLLFHAALRTRVTDPWSVSFIGPPDAFETIETLDASATLDLISVKPFDAQHFFQYPLLRQLPLDVCGRIRAIAATFGNMDNMDTLESLALFFTNPRLSAKALELLEYYGMRLGSAKLKTFAWVAASGEQHKQSKGYFAELAFLEHWSSHVDRIVALAVEIPNPDAPKSFLAEFDAIVVRDGKLIIHETKSVKPKSRVLAWGFSPSIIIPEASRARFIRRMQQDSKSLSVTDRVKIDFSKTATECLEDFWVATVMEQRVQSALNVRDRGLLNPILQMAQVSELGGIQFSVETTGGDLFRQKIVHEAERLTEQYGIAVHVYFPAPIRIYSRPDRPEGNSDALPPNQFDRLLMAFSLRKERQKIQAAKILPEMPLPAESQSALVITHEIRALMQQTYDLLLRLQEGLPSPLLSPLSNEHAANLQMLKGFLQFAKTGRLSRMLVNRLDAVQAALKQMLYLYSRTMEAGMMGHWQALLGSCASRQAMQAMLQMIQKKIDEVKTISEEQRLALYRASEPAFDVSQDDCIAGLAAWLSLWGIDRVGLAEDARDVRLTMPRPFFQVPFQKIQDNLRILFEHFRSQTAAAQKAQPAQPVEPLAASL